MSKQGATAANIRGVNFQSVSEDGVEVEIKNIGSNTGQFQSTIEVKASLDTVWNILTDYEHFADVVPCVSASKLLEKKANTSRVHQVGAVNLLLGMKFKAKAVVDYTEKEVEIDPNGKKRCLEFKMIEGDFQVYEGKWCIEQLNAGESEAVLRFEAVVKPKQWMPARLVTTIIGKEVKTNIACIREAAAHKQTTELKVFNN